MTRQNKKPETDNLATAYQPWFNCLPAVVHVSEFTRGHIGLKLL